MITARNAQVYISVHRQGKAVNFFNTSDIAMCDAILT